MDSILSPRHIDQHVETSDDDDDTKEERINRESSMATMLQHETAEDRVISTVVHDQTIKVAAGDQDKLEHNEIPLSPGKLREKYKVSIGVSKMEINAKALLDIMILKLKLSRLTNKQNNLFDTQTTAR